MTTAAYDNNQLDPLADALTALANANIINRPSDPAQELEYAAVSAAVAQAVALERIATLLESLLEIYKDSTEAEDLLNNARIWGS
jgi:hypothetical protein